jgi:hypothetical protein
VRFDLFDGVNYVSSGTPTPAVYGLFAKAIQTGGNYETWSAIQPLGVKSAGVYDYKVHWWTEAGTTLKIPTDEQPVQLWLMGI